MSATQKREELKALFEVSAKRKPIAASLALLGDRWIARGSLHDINSF